MHILIGSLAAKPWMNGTDWQWTPAKTEIIYLKNVGTSVAMNFT